MIVIACYDIENDKIRERVANKLLDFGLERIQFSVFVGPLNRFQFQKLRIAIEKILSGYPKSNLLIIPLSGFGKSNVYHCGDAEPDWEYLTGKKLTLIL
ncbi:MAG: CRISPR-associated endonuclease Cas2 [Spirosomataceae bacterium]